MGDDRIPTANATDFGAFDDRPYRNSLWRDYNDHIMLVETITRDDHGWLVMHGVIVYCTCGDATHQERPYDSPFDPDDWDIATGEVFGWSRMV